MRGGTAARRARRRRTRGRPHRFRERDADAAGIRAAIAVVAAVVAFGAVEEGPIRLGHACEQCDAATHMETIIALTAGSREEVDELVNTCSPTEASRRTTTPAIRHAVDWPPGASGPPRSARDPARPAPRSACSSRDAVERVAVGGGLASDVASS